MLSIQSRSTTCSWVRTEYAPHIDDRTKSRAKPISARKKCEVRLISRLSLVAGRTPRLVAKLACIPRGTHFRIVRWSTSKVRQRPSRSLTKKGQPFGWPGENRRYRRLSSERHLSSWYP